MPTPTVAPFTMKNIDLLFVGGDNYKAHVSRVRFDPTVPSTSWKGLAPQASYTGVGDATWTCNLSLAQDWDNPDSLAHYLLAHAGEQVDVQFVPKLGGQSFDATLILAPPSIGGDVDAVPTSEVACGVVGSPVPTPVGP